MKIIAIGDLHGRSTWKNIVNQNDYDKVIFTGDYFDTHDTISPQQQMDNFKDVIAFKKENPEKVTLLFGNHDYHYLPSAAERYTGFQRLHAADFSELIVNALSENFLQMCFVHQNILFIHAGLTKTWCATHGINMKNPEPQLNELLKQHPEVFRFTPGENFDATGDDITQSPIWVRPKSLLADKAPGYMQVVGHTQQKEITFADGIIFIDTLGTSREFMEVADGKFQTHTLIPKV